MKYYASEDSKFLLKETDEYFEIAEEGRGIITKISKLNKRGFEYDPKTFEWKLVE